VYETELRFYRCCRGGIFTAAYLVRNFATGALRFLRFSMRGNSMRRAPREPAFLDGFEALALALGAPEVMLSKVSPTDVEHVPCSAAVTHRPRRAERLGQGADLTQPCGSVVARSLS